MDDMWRGLDLSGHCDMRGDLGWGGGGVVGGMLMGAQSQQVHPSCPVLK